MAREERVDQKREPLDALPKLDCYYLLYLANDFVELFYCRGFYTLVNIIYSF